jgi:carboxypeptidase C (cathepsin A)
MQTSSILPLALSALLVAPAMAQDKPKAPDQATFVPFPEAPSVTFHSVEVNGQTIHYQATAGTLPLADGRKYDTAARIFYISYRKMTGPLAEPAAAQPAAEAPPAPPTPDFPDPATRPLTFSFNGGPGSSSVWLHLGIFGPRRVDHIDDFGNPGPPPHQVVNNQFSLLDKSDFVFIDPVSTGYSRAEPEKSEKAYHGVSEDIQSVAEFIRLYLGRENRWASPRFLAGESYGTTRAAGLSRELQNTHGIAVNGIILISAVLNFQTIRFDIGNDLPHILYLPTFAAVAHYHQKLSPEFQRRPIGEFLAEVEAFASNEYTLALMQGGGLPEDQADAIAERVAAYTGLTVDYVRRTNLRPDMPRFPKELLRDRGLTVGRLDARYTAADRDDAGASSEFDPSMTAIRSIYTESLNDYLRRELRYKSDLRYEILTSVWPWSYANTGNNRYTNVAEDLRNTMQQLPFMRVFVASGYHDLATPYFATEYTMNHLMVRPELRGNIEIHEYEAGHMMYTHRPSLEKLKRDLDAFYDRTIR